MNQVVRTYPRGHSITLKLTARQADVLWKLLAGEMDRDSYHSKIMRTFNQIGRNLSKAAGWSWINE